MFCLHPPTVERNGCHKITELRDLTLALADISDWTNLGYWLSVPHQIIQTIETDEKGTENKQRAVLRAWYDLQDHDPCWQSVTDALRQLGKNRLATRIDQCIHSIQSGTDCTLAICMMNGVDECTHSYNSIITTDAITCSKRLEDALWPSHTSQLLPGLHPTQGFINMNVVSD